MSKKEKTWYVVLGDFRSRIKYSAGTFFSRSGTDGTAYITDRDGNPNVFNLNRDGAGLQLNTNNAKLTAGGVIEKWGIVHRIDRETSGVLLVAKTQASFLNLKSQFQARTIKKSYRTFAYGFFKEKSGIIEKPIGRSTSDFRRWSAEYGARGELRDAVTDYRVIGRGQARGPADSEAEGVKLSYLEVNPHTGRTHQIRVHLKAVGHPILCDKLYAPKSPCLLGLDRTALHAFSIVFKGLDGAEHRVEAALPEDFSRAIAELGIV